VKGTKESRKWSFLIITVSKHVAEEGGWTTGKRVATGPNPDRDTRTGKDQSSYIARSCSTSSQGSF
jgi:hypothetical protein